MCEHLFLKVKPGDQMTQCSFCKGWASVKELWAYREGKVKDFSVIFNTQDRSDLDERLSRGIKRILDDYYPLEDEDSGQ